MYKFMAAILDFTWLPWLQANTGIVNNFLNPVLLRLETFLVTLALIVICILEEYSDISKEYKVRPTWI